MGVLYNAQAHPISRSSVYTTMLARLLVSLSSNGASGSGVLLCAASVKRHDLHVNVGSAHRSYRAHRW